MRSYLMVRNKYKSSHTYTFYAYTESIKNIYIYICIVFAYYTYRELRWMRWWWWWYGIHHSIYFAALVKLVTLYDISKQISLSMPRPIYIHLVCVLWSISVTWTWNIFDIVLYFFGGMYKMNYRDFFGLHI